MAKERKYPAPQPNHDDVIAGIDLGGPDHILLLRQKRR